MWFFLGLLYSSYLFWVVCPQPVHAYLNLGAGSQAFQALLATLLLVPFFVKYYWKGIKSLWEKIVEVIFRNNNSRDGEKST